MSIFMQKQQCGDIFSNRIEIVNRHDKQAGKSLEYISRIYHDNYNATVSPDPDIIVACKDKDSGELVACTGISFAAPSQCLFSERYLDTPLDALIFQQTDHVLSRHQVVEIGSLASDNPNAAADFIRIVPIIAWLMGSKAILCTSTRRLRKLLAFHQIPFTMLAEASSTRLSPEEKVAWGSYYDQAPQTGVILLEQCGHLFNHFCGRLVFSEFEHLARSALGSSQVAA